MVCLCVFGGREAVMQSQTVCLCFCWKKNILIAVGPRGVLNGKKRPSTPLCWLKQNKDVKKVQHCNKKGWALSHIIGYEESDRKMQWLKRLGRRLLYMYCNGQQLYWLYLSASTVRAYWSSLRGQYERFCGRVPEYLHRGPLQTGLRLRWRLEWKSPAPAETRREVQVFKASLPSPVEGQSAHFQLAAKV